jgi:hypothetical protein
MAHMVLVHLAFLNVEKIVQGPTHVDFIFLFVIFDSNGHVATRPTELFIIFHGTVEVEDGVGSRFSSTIHQKAILRVKHTAETFKEPLFD